MSERRRRARPATPSPTARWPAGPVRTSTGTVELVRDDANPHAVTLLVNGVPSSHLDLDDPTWLEFEYMQHMAAVVEAVTSGPLDAVHLGAGGCALPRWLDCARPGSRQVAVDVDADLLDLVRPWFGLPRAPRLRLRAGEAREVLAGMAAASADVVVRDVFARDQTPDHLTTVEFAREVARVLRPGGLYLANCADRPPLALARAEAATVAAVMSRCAVIAEPGQLKGRRYGNLVLAALTDEPPGDPASGASPRPPGDLGSPALARGLRSLPVPARLLLGPELRGFSGGASPRHDG